MPYDGTTMTDDIGFQDDDPFGRGAEMSSGRAWSMLDSAPDGMLLTDGDGIILVANQQVERLFGYGRTELIGQPIEVLIPDEHRTVHRAHRTRYRAEPTVRSMGTGLDLRARRADGTDFPVEVSLSPIRDRDGTAVVASIRDVTERRASEARAAAIASAVDAVHDGVFVFDAETLRFTHVNQGAVEQTGYSRAELLTMTPLHIKPDFTADEFAELISPVLSGELSHVSFRTIHRSKDGTDRPVDIVLESRTVPRGDRRVLLAVARDITERIEIDRRIERSEQLFRTAFEHSSAGMVVVGLGSDGDRTIQQVNASLCELLDRTESELLGSELGTFTHPDDRRADEIGVERLASGVDQRYVGERRYLRADGGQVWALLHASVIENDGDSIMLAHIVDLTERRVVQQERERMQMLEDRERIGRDLHDVVIQRLFAAGMGLQLITQGLGDAHATDVVQHTIDELDATIRELRSTIFGLANTGQAGSVAHDLADVIEDQIGALQIARKVVIDGDIESVPAVVIEQMVPTVREALTNVVKHANAASVVIHIVVSAEELTVCVDDDGVGVVDATGRGRGLDNLIARAERLSGSCVLEQRPEGGSRLRWSVKT